MKLVMSKRMTMPKKKMRLRRPTPSRSMSQQELVELTQRTPTGISRRDLARRLKLDPFHPTITTALHRVLETKLFRSGWRPLPGNNEVYQELAFYPRSST